MSKLAILGSSGMIGSHLKALFIHNNIEFIDVGRNMWNLSHWKTDEEFDEIFDNVKAIFYFAGALPTKGNIKNKLLFDINVRSCLNLAQWATKKNIYIIYLSSSTVYKNPHKKNILENDEKVIFGLGGFYGYTKLLAENIFNHYIVQGLKITILRPTSVYGLGLGNDQLINVFLNKAKSNDIISIPEGNNKINFMHAMDVSLASLKAYKNFSYGTFNIASNDTISIYDLAKISIDVAKNGSLGKVENVENPFTRFSLNCDKAINAFDFKSNINFKYGISAMYNSNMLEKSFDL